MQLYTDTILPVTLKINHSRTLLTKTIYNPKQRQQQNSTKDSLVFFIRKCLRNQHLETLQKRHDHFCESSRGKSGVTTTWTQISIVTDGCIGRGARWAGEGWLSGLSTDSDKVVTATAALAAPGHSPYCVEIWLKCVSSMSLFSGKFWCGVEIAFL